MNARQEALEILIAIREEVEEVKQTLGHPNSFWTTEGVKAATMFRAKAAAIIAKYAPEGSPYPVLLETILRIPFDGVPTSTQSLPSLKEC
jgi:hypothetical protein